MKPLESVGAALDEVAGFGFGFGNGRRTLTDGTADAVGSVISSRRAAVAAAMVRSSAS